MGKIAVLGAGGWGIAISNLLYQNGHEVALWEFFEADCRKLAETRERPDKLSGIKIPDEILITSDMHLALAEAAGLALVVPSHVMRSTTKLVAKESVNEFEFVVHLAKGIENNTLNRMSEVLLQELPGPYHNLVSCLSGPSHAEEVSRNIPTTVVAAAANIRTAELVQAAFANDYFRVYTSTDIIGVELGGSLKNVIAIAAGILDGLGLGDNTIGALLTRGLAEMVRLGRRMGADPITFSGLSGIGDLITTCTSRHSRNRYVGEQLGRGRKLDEILGSMNMVAEGVKTTKSAFDLARKYDVEMPITAEMHKILFENKDPKIALYDLMTRSPKPEVW